MLFSLGNPLLDVTIRRTDDRLLNKYGLKANDSLLAEPKHEALFEEVLADPSAEYSAGGSAQNTVRVARGLSEARVFFTGCVGCDAQATRLRAQLAASGIQEAYMATADYPTGLCASIVTDGGHNRSLIARLGAADHFDVAHLDTPPVVAALGSAGIVYQAGFALTVSFESTKRLVAACAAQARPYLFNISAPFLMIVPAFFERVKFCLSNATVVFGNEDEAAQLALSIKWPGGPESALSAGTAPASGASNVGDAHVLARTRWVAEQVLKLDRQNPDAPFVVVFTCGKLATIVGIKGQGISAVPIVSVNPADVLDTNGAGDAYVGGFLAWALTHGMVRPTAFADPSAVRKACLAGAYAASLVIQQPTTGLPEKLPALTHSGVSFPAAIRDPSA